MGGLQGENKQEKNRKKKGQSWSEWAVALPCKDCQRMLKKVCQKYSRIGALTLVPLEEEVTLKLHANHILKQIWNAMFWLVNEGLLTQMLARFKTGKLYISDL